VDWAGLLDIVLAVVAVFSGLVGVCLIVVVGCVVGISVVVGIFVWRVVVSQIKLARMLAFSASRSIHGVGGVVGMSGGVGGVSLVGAGGGVIGIVGGIVVVGIVIRKAVSQIRPAMMLAFSASKSMHGGGTVFGM